MMKMIHNSKWRLNKLYWIADKRNVHDAPLSAHTIINSYSLILLYMLTMLVF